MTAAITNILARLAPGGSFAAVRTSPSDCLRFEVDGAGAIPLPITPKYAKKLIDVATLAPFGRGSETIVDKNVRDSWKIPADRVRIDEQRFLPALRGILEDLAAALGLPLGASFEPQLHDLLIYGPGQFFLPHQDSEKVDGMVATLVVGLPSNYSGGDFMVTHNGRSKTFRPDPHHGSGQLEFMAFYADCRHEVRPIRSGFRAALTYTLALRGDTSGDEPSRLAAEELTGALRSYFATPRPRRWHDDVAETPDRLVYLLDHEYTEHSLRWSRLKPPDALRTEALLTAAQRLDCRAELGLLDVHEIWSTTEDWDSRRRRPGGPLELAGLIDAHLELHHFLERGATRPVARAARVDEREVAATLETSALSPFRSEHQPYTGNEGATADRWYHRAALILSPRSREFVIRAKDSASWAVQEIGRIAEAGDRETALRLCQSLRPFWATAARRESEPQFFDRVVEVTSLLGAPDIAEALLDPFPLEAMTPTSAPHLAPLLARFGLAWCRARLQRWTKARPPGDRRAWVARLPDVVGPLVRDGGADGRAFALGMLTEHWEGTRTSCAALKNSSPGHLAARYLAPYDMVFLALLECTLIIDVPALRQEMLAFLSSSDVPLERRFGLLHAALDSYPKDALAPLGLPAVHKQVSAEVEGRLSLPPRAKGDWSMDPPPGCTCELCRYLGAFLRSQQVRLDWPLAKEGRRHIHSMIDGNELPVSHETLRFGSPLTLVLRKTERLFDDEARARAAWEERRTWLVDSAPDFTEPKPRRRPRKRAP